MRIKLPGDKLLNDSITPSVSDPNRMKASNQTVCADRYHNNDQDNYLNYQECWNSSTSLVHERQDAQLQSVGQSVAKDTGDDKTSSLMPMIQEGRGALGDREGLELQQH